MKLSKKERKELGTLVAMLQSQGYREGAYNAFTAYGVEADEAVSYWHNKSQKTIKKLNKYVDWPTEEEYNELKRKKEIQMTDYLWLDCEMTGLNHKTCRIVEVACILTKDDLVPYARWEAIIYQRSLNHQLL